MPHRFIIFVQCQSWARDSNRHQDTVAATYITRQKEKVQAKEGATALGTLLDVFRGRTDADGALGKPAVSSNLRARGELPTVGAVERGT